MVSLSYGLSLVSKKPLVWGYPPILMLEPTNICNLRCPLCPTGNQTLQREKGMMELSLFRKVVDEVHPYTSIFLLWSQGEPFLNPHFLEMVRYAADHDIFTWVSTNANAEMDAEAIVRSGMDSLIISLDGATQETYNQYRVNGDITKVWENVRNIVAWKKKLKSATPFLEWQFLMMKHNEHELALIQKLADELEVDAVVFKTVQIYEEADIERFLPINPKYRRYKILNGNFQLKHGVKNRCIRLWIEPVINWNGDVSVCCFDKDIKYAVGNVRENSLASVFRGKSFQNMRQRVLTHRAGMPLCLNCGEGVKLQIDTKRIK
jgi:MoaA/NifB/PqqE/SkfB family radical SAM enzyme